MQKIDIFNPMLIRFKINNEKKVTVTKRNITSPDKIFSLYEKFSKSETNPNINRRL